MKTLTQTEIDNLADIIAYVTPEATVYYSKISYVTPNSMMFDGNEIALEHDVAAAIKAGKDSYEAYKLANQAIDFESKVKDSLDSELKSNFSTHIEKFLSSAESTISDAESKALNAISKIETLTATAKTSIKAAESVTSKLKALDAAVNLDSLESSIKSKINMAGKALSQSKGEFDDITSKLKTLFK